jgi:hypothetical protein
MSVGGVGAATLDLVRSSIATDATQDETQVAMAKKALDAQKLQGQAALKMIESAGLGQFVNVRA